MIVGLSGYAQAGKDTAAEVFVRYGFQRYSFADPMREMALAIDPIVAIVDVYSCGDTYPEELRYSEAIDANGYEKAKAAFPEVRAFLQRLGTDAGRKILGEDVWVDAAMRKMAEGGDYVIPDVRFVNEAEAIRNAGGMVFRIHRPGRGPVNDHESEIALDDYEHFTNHIWNDSTIDVLQERAWALYMQENRIRG
jgi:hypothetical protein